MQAPRGNEKRGNDKLHGNTDAMAWQVSPQIGIRSVHECDAAAGASCRAATLFRVHASARCPRVRVFPGGAGLASTREPASSAGSG